MSNTFKTIIGLALFIGLVVWLALLGKPTTDIPIAVPVVEKAITVTGTQVCLPHKNTDGPQTLECALGLKDSVAGEYYALDLSAYSEIDSNDYGMDQEIVVSGAFTPVEALSDDYWQIYTMKGIIRVSNMVEAGGEVAVVKNYIQKNIGVLAPISPVLGGSWYVVSTEINQDENTARVVYEDGHIQGIMRVSYLYDENNKSVTVTNVEEE